MQRPSRTDRQHPNMGRAQNVSGLLLPGKYSLDGNDQEAKVTYFQADSKKIFRVSLNKWGTRALEDQVPSVPGLHAGMCEQIIPPMPLPRRPRQEKPHLSSVPRPRSVTGSPKKL